MNGHRAEAALLLTVAAIALVLGAGIGWVPLVAAPLLLLAIVLAAAASRRRATWFLLAAFVPLLISSGLINQLAHVGIGATLQKLGSLAGLLLLFAAVGIQRPPTPVMWLLGVFSVTFLVTVYRLPGLDVGFDTALRAWIGYCYPFLVFFAAWRTFTATQIMRVVAWLPALALVVGAGLQVAGLHPLLWQEYTGTLRLTGGLAAAYLGAFGMFGAFAAMWLWRGGTRYGLWLAMLNVAVTFATGTRGPSIGALILVWSAIVFAQRHGRPIPAVAKAGAAAVVFGAFAYFVPIFLARTNDQGSLQGALSGRDLAWSYFWDVFTQHPVLGNGIGASSVAGQESAQSLVRSAFVAPHNTYLQFLVDFGVVGAVVAVLALVGLFVTAWRATTGYSRMMVVVLGLAMAFYAFFDNLLTSPQPALSFTVVLAALLLAGRSAGATSTGAPPGSPSQSETTQALKLVALRR